MKSSTNKTTARSQAAQSKPDSKSSRSPVSAGRGTASGKSTATARSSRSNNPEGHNQYTKKTGDCK